MKRRNWLWTIPAAIGVMIFRAKDESTEQPMMHESIKIVHSDGTVYYPLVAKHIDGQERIPSQTTVQINSSTDTTMMSIGRKP